MLLLVLVTQQALSCIDSIKKGNLNFLFCTIHSNIQTELKKKDYRVK